MDLKNEQIQTKTCNKCGNTYPITDFYVRKQSKDGRDLVCKYCKRAYAQWFRDNFPERAKEISAKTREKNKEKIRERQREKYLIAKQDPEFKKRRLENARKFYDKNHKKNRKKLLEFIDKKPCCAKCGENRKYLIQFHHIDPKTKKFSIGAFAVSKRKEVLEEEMKKCVCLCSNCHDEFHWFYGQKPKHPKEDLEEYLGKKL